MNVQGCNRSFAELWRLKVHHRAPPDVRGSGKERGHGTELTFCPKCGKDLMPGKHHVGCSAGKSAPRQAAKRQRQVTVSTTTVESDWASETEPTTTQAGASASFEDVWPSSVRQRSMRARRQRSMIDESELVSQPRDFEADMDRRSMKDSGHNIRSATSASGRRRATPGLPGPSTTCRFGLMHQTLNTGDHNTAELVFTANAYADFGLILHNGVDGPKVGDSNAQVASPWNESSRQGDTQEFTGRRDVGTIQTVSSSCRNPNNPETSIDAPSGMFDGDHLPDVLCGEMDNQVIHGDGVEDLSSMLRVPSPPPLPPGWETGPPMGMLFDFDQFDASRRLTLNAQQDGIKSTAPPEQTITSTMQPSEVSNPSDDYIWQIMFASENESIPKRVTAHLHHPLPSSSSPRSLGSDGKHEDLRDVFEDADPFVDSIVAAMNHHGGKLGTMPPPPPRQPSGDVTALQDQNDFKNKIREGNGIEKSFAPPLPNEALEALGPNKGVPTSLTVTYDVSYDNGAPKYVVRHVQSGNGIRGSPPGSI